MTRQRRARREAMRQERLKRLNRIETKIFVLFLGLVALLIFIIYADNATVDDLMVMRDLIIELGDAVNAQDHVPEPDACMPVRTQRPGWNEEQVF